MIMNNETTIFAREQKTDAMLNMVATVLNQPLKQLTLYYNKVLDRELNIRQTLHLLNAQAAFVMTIMPADAPWLVRLLCAFWLVKALLGCKKVL
jgi:hypothetical protein